MRTIRVTEYGYHHGQRYCYGDWTTNIRGSLDSYLYNMRKFCRTERVQDTTGAEHDPKKVITFRDNVTSEKIVVTIRER